MWPGTRVPEALTPARLEESLNPVQFTLGANVPITYER